MPKKESFGLESTLSGKTYVRLLMEAKQAGFEIVIHFVLIASPEFAIRRIAQRVSKGGHHVPSEDVQRRFQRVKANFMDLYVPIADQWYVWDNSGESGHMLARHAETSIDTLERILAMNPPSIVQEKTESPEVIRAIEAWKRAYQDVVEENKRWGLPMVTLFPSATPPAPKTARRKKAV